MKRGLYLSVFLMPILSACSQGGFEQAAQSSTAAKANIGYVPIVTEGSVVVIDTAGNRIVEQIPNVVARPTILRALPDRSKIYVLNYALTPPYEVGVISTATDTVIKKIPVSGVTTFSFQLSPDGSLLYVPSMPTDPTISLVDVIDTATDTVIRSLQVPSGIGGIEVSPDGSALYLVFSDGTAGAYDPATGQELRPPISGGGTFPVWTNISADGSKLYTINLDDSIGVIDVHSWTLSKTIPTGAGSSPVAGTVTPDGRQLYISNLSAHNLLVIDTQTDAVLRTIDTGDAPDVIVFPPDGRRGYVSTLGGASPLFLPHAGIPVFLALLFAAPSLVPSDIVTYDTSTDQVIGDPIVTGSVAGIGVFF